MYAQFLWKNAFSRYFEDPAVLQNVPRLFLVLAGIFASLQLIGLNLLRTAPKEDPTENEFSTLISMKESETEQVSVSSENRSTWETVSRSDFWLIWTIFFSVQLMQTFVNSYQKTYGFQFIGDDFFFSYVGLASNVLNGLSRIAWGFLYDLKGFKVSQIQLTISFAISLFLHLQFNANLIVGSSTFLTFTFLFLYLINDDILQKVFFALWMCGFYAFFPGIYSTMAPVTQATFGHLNYSRDYGLLFTQSVSLQESRSDSTKKIHLFQMVGSLVLIFSSQVLFDKIGYIGMFSICGCFGLLGLLATWKFTSYEAKRGYVRIFWNIAIAIPLKITFFRIFYIHDSYRK